MTIDRMRNRLSELSGRRDFVSGKLEQARAEVQKFSKDLELIEQAREIIQRAAQQTQDSLRYHISSLVSAAMEAVFDEPYGLDARFTLRRGRTECDLVFTKDGHEFSDLAFVAGGGPVDVASFALRVAIWSLTKDASSVLILDEPLKWLKGAGLPERGSHMLKEVSSKVGLQMLVVSHIPDQIGAADRVFRVTQQEGVSSVEVKDVAGNPD